MSKKGKGKLFVVSAPSGAGKTTVAVGAMEKLKNIKRSVSWTTREPRQGEIDGKDYKFVSVDEFKKNIDEDGFIEWAKVFEEYYGTPFKNVENAKKGGFDLFLIIDVLGADQIRKKNLDAVFVFVLPPSMDVLERRLKERGLDSPEEIEKRLNEAKREIEQSKYYDYKIVNKDLEKAVNELVKIVVAERV